MLKFSPHLKPVAALPCETCNVKWIDIQQPFAHTQAVTQLVDVIYAFLSTSGPKQPRYEPVDYKIWAVLQHRVYYEKHVNDVDKLCQRLLSVWHRIRQNVIDEAIDQWCVRLTVCVRAKGGHFEHLM